jgi:hypothetical protein
VQVEQSKRQIHAREPKTVNRKQRCKFAFPDHDTGKGWAEDHVVNCESEKELQGVNVEQDDKEQHASQEARGRVIQAEAATKFVMRVPNRRQHQEANGESRKAAYRVDEIGKTFWHFQRNDKQRKCKREDRIGERFQARDFAASHAKAIHYVRIISHARLAQHGWSEAFRHIVRLPDGSL